MSEKTTLLIATANPGKLREMRALLNLDGLRLVSLTDREALHKIEEGSDYAENARRKAASLARITGNWTVADDSGLEVDALGGAPGPRSARIAGEHASDAERRRMLLGLLQPHPHPWTARFRCTMALASPEGAADLAVGLCEGEIVSAEAGSGGFGYDPIFLVAGLGQTMAELSEADKNRVSHRARAVQALLPTLYLRLNLQGPARPMDPPAR
jgi:XTP/dITP diphosphohydrolase